MHNLWRRSLLPFGRSALGRSSPSRASLAPTVDRVILWKRLALVRSNPETADHHLQLIAQPRQFNARCSGFIAGGGGLFGHIAYVDDAAADLFGHGALLLGGSGDLLVHRLDVGHRASDVSQRGTGLA